MGRTIRFLLILFIPLSTWAFDPFPKEKKTTTPPNPYELMIGWWNFYDVDSKELVEKKQETDSYFNKIREQISREEEAQAQPYFERIDAGLSILIQLKEATPEVPSTIPPAKEHYTYQEWVNLSRTLSEKKEEVQYLKLRLDLAKSSYKSGSNHLDGRFSEYLKGKRTDPNRLINGLEIIQARIYLAIEKIQLNNLERVVNLRQSELNQLQDQANLAYKKVDFSTISYEKVEEDLQAAKAKESEAKNQFLFSYEKSIDTTSTDSIQSEKLDQESLNVKLNYEISRVDVINLQIQKEILSWIEKKEPYSRKSYRKKVENWQTSIDEIRRDLSSSEDSSELVLQQTLKSIALEQEQYGYAPYTNETLELAESAILKIEQLKNSLATNAFLFDQLDEFRRDIHFSLYEWTMGRWEAIIDIIKTNTKWFSRTLFKIGEFPITPIAIFKFILILAIAIILGKVIRHYISYFGRKQRRIPMRSIHVLGRVFYYFVILIGFLIAGSAIGFNVTIFAYIAGALAIWVGFGLQSIFHNFISGIIVLGTKTIRLNDVIELDTGDIGTVTDLNLRTTVIRTFDEKDVVIPNADIINKKFLNLTLSSHTLRVKIPFRFGLSEDKKKIEKIVVEAAKKVEITSEARSPELWLTGFGENSINAELVVWINTLLKGRTASWYSQYFWAIDDAFRENGIQIPIPVQRIHLSEPKQEYPIGAAEPIPIKPKDEPPTETF